MTKKEKAQLKKINYEDPKHMIAVVEKVFGKLGVEARNFEIASEIEDAGLVTPSSQAISNVRRRLIREQAKPEPKGERAVLPFTKS